MSAPEALPPLGSELTEIRRRFDAGELDGIREDLDRFLRTHREEILRFKSERQVLGIAPVTDELAVKFYIIRTRSINAQAEIQDQLREIEREKWIWGVHQGRPPNPNEVMSEWARRYSAGWRSHRVTTILYVFDREQEKFLALLREAEGSPEPPSVPKS